MPTTPKAKPRHAPAAAAVEKPAAKDVQATRDAMELAHTQLLGEQAPNQVDDPLREYPLDVQVEKTVAWLKGQIFQHLPKSLHAEFVKHLKAAL